MSCSKSGHVPARIVRVQLQLHCHPGMRLHIAGYSREDPGVLEFNNMVMVEPMFRHRRLVWTSKSYVLVVLLYSDVYSSTSLSDVHVATLALYSTIQSGVSRLFTWYSAFGT